MLLDLEAALEVQRFALEREPDAAPLDFATVSRTRNARTHVREIHVVVLVH